MFNWNFFKFENFYYFILHFILFYLFPNYFILSYFIKNIILMFKMRYFLLVFQFSEFFTVATIYVWLSAHANSRGVNDFYAWRRSTIKFQISNSSLTQKNLKILKYYSFINKLCLTCLFYGWKWNIYQYYFFKRGIFHFFNTFWLLEKDIFFMWKYSKRL